MIFPNADEYAEFYSGYIKYIPDSDNIINVLEDGRDKLQTLIKSIPEEKANYFYAEGKWSIKEVLGHMADSERVLSYRAMCFARSETKSLPGFEQDDYVKAANFTSRSLTNIADELRFLRNANITLFKSFNENTLLQKGIANDYVFTVRAILFIIAGHELHHMKILKERYL